MRDDTGKIEKRRACPGDCTGAQFGNRQRGMPADRLRASGGNGTERFFRPDAEETDEFCSSSAAARLEDLHEAFADRTVDGILTVIGGFNSVEILAGIDYRLIAENPKILCGFPILPRWQTQFMPRPVWSPIRDRIFPLSAC